MRELRRAKPVNVTKIADLQAEVANIVQAIGGRPKVARLVRAARGC